MRRDVGNEVIVAIAVVAVLAFAIAFGVLLSVSNPDNEADSTATAQGVSSNLGGGTADIQQVSPSPDGTEQDSGTDTVPSETEVDESTSVVTTAVTAVTQTEMLAPTTTEAVTPEITLTVLPTDEKETSTARPTEDDLTSSPEPTETRAASEIDTRPAATRPTRTLEPTATNTQTPRPTFTDVPTRTSTRTATTPPTATMLPTSTPTTTPSATRTATSSPTVTITRTPTTTRTNTPNPTATSDLLPTPVTPSPTATSRTAASGSTPVITTIARQNCPIPNGWHPYVVQPGNTLFSIARAVDSTVNGLREANCLSNANQIIAGDVLYLPRPLASSLPGGAQISSIGCQSPAIQIISPSAGQSVGGVVIIFGSADLPNFEYYKLEVRGASQVDFNFIDRWTTPVTNGELGEVNTSLFSPGLYWVRLVVVDNTGNVPEVATCTVPMIFN